MASRINTMSLYFAGMVTPSGRWSARHLVEDNLHSRRREAGSLHGAA